jgi:hypothetical protein
VENEWVKSFFKPIRKNIFAAIIIVIISVIVGIRLYLIEALIIMRYTWNNELPFQESGFWTNGYIVPITIIFLNIIFIIGIIWILLSLIYKLIHHRIKVKSE